MEVADDRTRNRARSLRRRSTPAEAALWKLLRGRGLDGLKFRRQGAIGRFVVDFVSYQARLIVEADGGVHRLRECEDAERDAWLQAQGFQVLRLPNSMILGSPDEVRRTILEARQPPFSPCGRRWSAEPAG